MQAKSSRFLPAVALITAFAGAGGYAAANLANQQEAPLLGQDMCTATTLCDNTQIKLGMRDASGNISVDSQIGRALANIASTHTSDIDGADVVDLMTRFEGVLTHALPTPTAVGIDGMMLMKGPQKPGEKARYGVFALLQGAPSGCAVYEIKTNGQYAATTLPTTVGYHSSPVPGCLKEASTLARMMTQRFDI